MGIVACLLFGIIGAWISRSLLIHAAGNLKTVLVIGAIGGTMGLIGTTIGWGDPESFNLYNVLLSIAFSAIIMFLYSKGFAKSKTAS